MVEHVDETAWLRTRFLKAHSTEKMLEPGGIRGVVMVRCRTCNSGFWQIWSTLRGEYECEVMKEYKKIVGMPVVDDADGLENP